MITAADYVDWAHYAGIYTGNVSHVDRYRTYTSKISPAGLTVQIVHDFLAVQPTGIDVQSWRQYDVYEPGTQAQYRLDVTADALERIGAARVAAKVRVAKDTSLLGMLMNSEGDIASTLKAMENLNHEDLMDQFRESVAHALPEEAAAAGITPTGPAKRDPEIETREQIEAMLTTFVRQNQSALQADYEKFGDVRKNSDFDPKARMEELRDQHAHDAQREYQIEEAEKLAGYLPKMEKKLSANQRLGSLRKHALHIYRRWSGQSNLHADLQSILTKADALFAQHPGIFFPAATSDTELQARISAIGHSEVDPKGDSFELHWPAPESLRCEFGQFSLETNISKDDDQTLVRIIQAVEDLIGRWPEVVAEMRPEIQAHFVNYYLQMDAEDQADYEVDAAGQLTEAAIKEHCEGGTIYITVEDWAPDQVQGHLYMGVSWDLEHGFEWEF